MIYLDNGATSYPKPREVYQAHSKALSVYGANPGRSGHEFSMRTAAAVYQSREVCGEFFGAQPENTVFTLNCTHALNYAIKGIAKHGCHFVASDMEHNAAARPMYAAARVVDGSCTLFEAVEDEEITIKNVEHAIRPNTAAVICTAASNVFGLRTPISEIAALCRRHGICFILDAAQGAGVFSITLKDADIICAAGHKGLYGPMGTGLMITNGEFPLSTIIEGGTGSFSESILQPDFTPDRFESGTLNTAGVIALGAGVGFVKRKTPAAILAHELDLCEQFCRGVSRLDGITLRNEITPRNRVRYAPIVSFNFDKLSSEDGARLLSSHGFYMRGGLHCAPLAHKKLGTIAGGTIRFSPSVFNTSRQVDLLISTLYRLCKAI